MSGQEIKRSSQGRALLLQKTALGVGMVSVGLAIVLACFRGLDLTDESYYLLSIRSPFAYETLAVFFGFFYHPHSLLVQHDPVLLRLTNVAVTLSLASLFGFSLLKRTVAVGGTGKSKVLFPVISAGLLILLFGPFLEMRMTPSYNTMALQGILLAVAGAFLIRGRPRASLLMVAAGGLILFLAKPPGAVLLGILVLGYLLVTRSASWTILGWLGILILLGFLLLAIGIGESPVKVFSRYLDSAEFARKIDPMYSVSNLLRPDWPPIKLRQLLVGGLVVGVLLWIGKTSPGPKFQMVGMLAGGTALLIVGLNQGGLPMPSLWIDEIGLQVLAFPAAAMVLFGSHTGKNPFRCLGLPETLLLLLLPYVYVFGTGRAYWDNMPGACYFWFMAAVPLILTGFSAEDSEKILIPWTLIFLLMGSCIFSIAGKNPYRQNQPLAKQSGELKLAGWKVGLRVEQERADYCRALQRGALPAGLVSGNYLIDLSGGSQGVSVVLDLIPLGSPWMPGGYPGSLEVAEFLLRKTDPKKLKESWILTTPDSRRRLDIEILKSLNLNFPDAYDLAFSVVLPGGKRYPLEPIRQEFYRPKNTECKSANPLAPNNRGRDN